MRMLMITMNVVTLLQQPVALLNLDYLLPAYLPVSSAISTYITSTPLYTY